MGISYQTGIEADFTVKMEFVDAAWSTGTNKIDYEASIFVDEATNTVYMWELTVEKSTGFSFGFHSKSTFQSGATLFRKVKSVQYSPDGKIMEFTLDLGTIPKAVKDAAKNEGLEFIIITVVLQSISHLAFSGILQKSAGFMFVLLGLVIGAFLGATTKLTLRNKMTQYQENLFFSFPYLLLLLINQIIALIFCAYLPIIIFLAAIAFGIQVGFQLTVLVKSKKLKRVSGMLLGLVLLAALPISIFAKDDGLAFKIDPESYQNHSYVYRATIPASMASASFPLPLAGTDKGKLVNADYEGINPVGEASVDLYYPDEIHIQFCWSYSYIEQPSGAYMGNTSFMNEYDYKLPLSKDGSFSGVTTIEEYMEIVEHGGGVKSEPVSLNWNIDGKVGKDGCDLTVLQDNGNEMTFFIAFPKGMTPPQLGAGSQITIDNNSAETVNPASSQQDQASVPENDEEDSNWFTPQPVEDDSANAASAIGGIAGGLAALIALLGTFTNQTQGAGTGFTLAQTPTFVPKPPVTKPIPGTRREDGKIYTKNNGWQNESFPELQTTSLQNSIHDMENKLQTYKDGDILAEVTRDMIKEDKLKLQQWSEDATTIRKTQSLDNEAMYQNQTERWNDRAAQMENAAETAETISFVGDLALAAATSGSSCLFSGAKNLGAMRSALQAVNNLSKAKNYLGSAANVYDNYLESKNLAAALTKEGLNYGLGKGTGKLFVKGKVMSGFQKYGAQKSSDGLKLLIAAGETYGASAAQSAAEGSGLTGAITDAVKTADEHYQAVGKSMHNLANGEGKSK